MSVFPFYVKVNSSSRKTPVGVGAKSKNSDMTVEIMQRDKGEITTPYTIRQVTCENTETGKITLMTQVYKNGVVIDYHETEY